MKFTPLIISFFIAISYGKVLHNGDYIIEIEEGAVYSKDSGEKKPIGKKLRIFYDYYKIKNDLHFYRLLEEKRPI